MLLLIAVFLLVVVSISHVRQSLMPDHAVTSSEIERAPEHEEFENKVTPTNLDNIIVPLEALAEAKPLPHNITVCTLVQNEAPYVAEWIAYHRLLGVDHFIFYNNNSTDNLEEALGPFAARGWVSVINAERDYNGGWEIWDFQDQCNRNNEEALSSRWLGHFDVDEFLIVPGANLEAQLLSLPSILDHYENFVNCTGLVIDRFSFASGPHVERPKTGLVIENYVEREIMQKANHPEVFPKTIGMPKYMKFDYCHDFHLESSIGNGCLANTQRWACDKHCDRTKVFEPLRFQHYHLRSKEECEEKLERRKNDVGDLDYRVLNGNTLCERGVHGGQNYSPKNYVTDLTLASSEWPSMIRAFLKELNHGTDVFVQ
jgi:hypothetical protein